MVDRYQILVDRCEIWQFKREVGGHFGTFWQVLGFKLSWGIGEEFDASGTWRKGLEGWDCDFGEVGLV